MHPLLTRLVALDLDPSSHALFGSGPLLVRGWIDTVGDLDVIARGKAWKQAIAAGQLELVADYGVDIVTIGESITVGTQWGIGDFFVDELIDTAETIDGIQCVLLEHVIAYKEIARRPKDIDHLAVIAANDPRR
ncbi:MAG: hypothetical protein DWP92_07985 [Armatimonadetes bacterium]|nr:MAG: hypothetical protein DWP92_07985 [Armatimonadota bacterium]